MNWFVDALKKYAVFSGRAQRSEYWYFFLFYFGLAIGAALLDGMVGAFNRQAGVGVFGSIVALGLLLPSLAVGVRRLHDIDRSGWWLLIAVVPVVGAIVLLVFSLKDSQPGSNRFGPNPKDAFPSEKFSLT
ncbi:uncharacterized membrane protein YhaH (DUF805 family) [Rhodoferax ferrireducens]|uniref:Uncharacterized membrane protein YhaH (DUF805 family) n=1 Tax=Rhodoferax ferrireducens TaxID=192843 RepID=A0ABU2CE23_9BURK|nr:DUF805 domain-containing protein [Rhodoferax ferrireducens]MDR7379589.1 uncharacterized membrane protein YhaH (DUF805 family) [Rhodoferax ferrireducens]